jgi:hypothetical protein
MAPIPFIPSVAGVAVAATAVVIGAPLFSAGLRTLRLRRAFARVAASRLSDAPEGFVVVSGRVALDSPLFTPVSMRRCAGWRLEASGIDFPVSRSVEEVRPFRLVESGIVAQVEATRARWTMAKTAVRVLEPEEPLSERMLHLLSEMPEAAWLRQSGRRIRLVERALLSGVECHVMGQAARTREVAVREEVELLRTGTDDRPIAFSTLVAATGDAPSLWIGPADHTDFMHVSDSPIDPAALGAPVRNLAGLLAGPLLALLGLLYLAAAASHWRGLPGL